MRGEHCVAAASVLSAIALIMLVFANIGQLSPGPFTSSIYMAEVNVAAYGNALQTATKVSAGGLYDTKNDALGKHMGLRQYYRYGLYSACGYQKSGSGVCNMTFAYPMQPLADIIGDVPAKFIKQTVDIIPEPSVAPNSAFKDNGYNANMSRAGSVFIFIGSALCAVALIAGVFKARLFFFIASLSSGLSAFLLMLGAALWSALIAKDATLKIVKVEYGANLGIYTSAGATLYLTWVAFVCMVLATVPYVVACLTYRK